MRFKEDENNWYYYGKPDYNTERTLSALGFYYNRTEFDDFGNKFEVWIKNKEE